MSQQALIAIASRAGDPLAGPSAARPSAPCKFCAGPSVAIRMYATHLDEYHRLLRADKSRNSDEVEQIMARSAAVPVSRFKAAS